MSIPEFWRLVIESRLLNTEQCQALNTEFSQAQSGGDVSALASWLVAKRAISAYHAKVLQAGRSGPFEYGDYRVFDRLEGRFAGMFRAAHRATGYPVILQFLAGAAVKNPQLWSTAASRTRRLAQVKHPQIQRVFEPVDLQSFKFAVIEDLQGRSLDSMLSKSPLPASEACRVIRLAALALGSLHEAKLIHGDIRPRNLWLEPSGNVRLLIDPFETPASFQSQQITDPDKLAARSDYLAPEMLHPGKEPDELTDIYGLGCTLYELVAGRPPFAGGEIDQKMQRHASEAIVPLEQFGAPQAVSQLVSYMMAKNAQVRYQEAAVVAQQVSQLVPQEQVQAPAPSVHPRLAAFEESLLQNKPTPSRTPGGAPSFAGIQTAGTAGTASGPAKAPLVVAEDRRKPGEPKAMFSKKNLTYLGISGAAAAVLALGLLIAWGMSGDESDPIAAGDPATTPTSATTPAGTPTDAAPTAPVVSGPNAQVVVPDDGETLWESPTMGQPISFRYVPPGSQILLYARPADLLATPQGAAALQALGPDFAAVRADWEKASGFPLEEVNQLIVSFHDNPGRAPRPCVVAYLKNPTTTNQLLEKWGDPAPTAQGEANFYNANGYSFYAPTQENGNTFVMGALPEIKDVIANGIGVAPMSREMGDLARTTDADRQLTLLVAPGYLYTDGRPLMAGPRERLLDPLKWFLSEGVKAALISANVTDHTYLEVRVVANLNKDRIDLATELRDKLDDIPGMIEDYMAYRLDPHPFWKKLANRYPGMIRELRARARVGDDDQQAMVNAVLPAAAASNLLKGGELTISQTPGAPLLASTDTKPTTPQTMDELLQFKTNMSFAQKSLEFALRDIAEDLKSELKNLPFDLEVKIIGADLEKDGLTRNQQVRDVVQRDKTVAEILTAVVVTAMATGKPPTDPAQKMIWVVGPDPDNPSKQSILITTRAAAEIKGYTLPAVFVGS
ncbi:serine/threonine protein kinase [Lignipirellula cremea]|uniref:Serine/threonine-protein kinase PknB n=1 Tax=Lignipirellula cremea TaxID=2528010 RepID=A0A518E0Y7_9BACT|nr:protein kinase [Lignipirellula cremea]QDU97742.1 Serine/threonine-protein kinase PknB [Lignipirellula cremea]